MGRTKTKIAERGEEDYTALSNLKAIKEKLETWVSQEAPPTEQEVLREFRELKSIPKVKEWHEVESLLLTTEELMNAGMRQQSLHLLNGMTLDLTNDLPVTASTSCEMNDCCKHLSVSVL